LRSQRGTEDLFLLVPLTPTVFGSETNDPVRVEFMCAPDGRPERLLFNSGDGSREEAPRIP
jgi:hypothetical protein